MSAVFEAAAMSLLSRTLTTALGKYLSNVDVEGLDWGGIRISKVELKAAKLMNLPGKPTRSCDSNEKDEEEAKQKNLDDASIRLEGLDDHPPPPSIIETRSLQDPNDASKNHTGRQSWFSSWYSSKTDDVLMDASERPEASSSASPTTTKPTTSSYSLELCTGGRLGILDVRLVGKALQVLVEDADITLRVISNSDSTPDKPTSSNTARNTKPTSSTTGDRVLEENVLAKILSGIPNLLLRDIRVKLILDERSTIELTIGLLSVTDGSIDILAQFGDANDPEEEELSTSTSSGDESDTISSPTENQFLTKRIRTGRGVDGGITIRVLVPREKSPKGDVTWSRDAWYSMVPDYCFLRLSGLDLQGKIFLGSAAEVAKKNQYYRETEAVVDVDELLFSGVDAIAPGPIPSLPPAPAIADPVTEDAEPTIMADFTTDQNGIQSCKLSSNFHRVARGLIAKTCQCDRTPNDCECWTDDRFPEPEEDSHDFDQSLPMPGLVLSISTRDPLELNVDRPSLETLGTLIACFTRTSDHEQDQPITDESLDLATTIHRDDLDLMPSESMRSRHSATTQHTADRRTVPRRHLSSDGLRTPRRHRQPAPPKTFRDYPVENGFPSYMQPEKIQIIGVCIPDLRFRIHVLRRRGLHSNATSFCFWDCTVQKAAVDFQTLSAHERPFQDLRMSLGKIRVVEYKGVQCSQTILLGNDLAHNRDGDESTAATTATSQIEYSSLWPSTAAVMCNSQILFEPPPPSVASLQFRYLAVRNSERHFDHDHKSAVVLLGRTFVNTSFSIKDEIMTILSEARTIILPNTSNNHTSSDQKDLRRQTSLLVYKATIQSGSVHLDPIINASIPTMTVNGEISSNHGFSLETALAGIKITHGEKSKPAVLTRGLTLHQLADLPETVRLRILLFIHDLGPLQDALGIRPARNSFLQCRAVNNGIVTYVAKLRKRSVGRPEEDTPPKTTPRRQELLNELNQMDDMELEALLASRRGLYML